MDVASNRGPRRRPRHTTGGSFTTNFWNRQILELQLAWCQLSVQYGTNENTSSTVLRTVVVIDSFLVIERAST
jgi:hypothetical protein